MHTFSFCSNEKITDMAKTLFQEERARTRLDGWFRIREAYRLNDAEYAHLEKSEKAANLLFRAVEALPLDISDSALFAGTQRDAFARSYALINPSFEVESFAGYCDPTAVYGDIEPNDEFPKERIEKTLAYDRDSAYVRALSETYESVEALTGEVAFFIEQVTGHVIPDVRPILRHGVCALIQRIEAQAEGADDPAKRSTYRAMKRALEAVLLLARRYADIARQKAEQAAGDARERLLTLWHMLEKVPAEGANTLAEAIQSFLLVWQVMCIEQAPNPFAFSVGNADRIFEEYRQREGLSRKDAAALLKHLLVFFNVGDRSWAISQNLLISGRDVEGNDLTNETSYALLDAYYDMNLPQPILSVKLHKNTPDALYRELGRFLFTPGCLTPSFFSDDAVFDVLARAGIEERDLPDYAVAGCQEMLVMGQDNGNTTNSWLNLAKVLELTLNGGKSLLTGAQMGEVPEELPPEEALRTVRERFYALLDFHLGTMRCAANGASEALSNMPVPFLSSMMGSVESGYDMRDMAHQGTKYAGSGCLIHGLAVVADSFTAIDCLLRDRPEDAARLLTALQTNFENDEELRAYLLACPKYGNNEDGPDREAVALANAVADRVARLTNSLGARFRPDFSTPSTHLLYGYWVGALPNGRKAREMLNYGVDPLAGDAAGGMGLRALSTMKLPFEKFAGGYASHFGIDPKYFSGATFEEKGVQFKARVIEPLFFNPLADHTSPFYLYVNVTTAETLRKVLDNPAKYAPGGVYIMRIHGTFVNFLDLSPAIQQDIIRRLDPSSTALGA